MQIDYPVRRIWIQKSEKAKAEWENLLKKADIRPEETIEYTVAMYDGDKLIATGSYFQNVLKCIAVCKSYTGGEVISKLISHLMSEVFQNGYSSCYVYTKPESVQSFVHMGFKEIARVPDHLVFLEKTTYGIDAFTKKMVEERKDGRTIAGIVMNANPFTKGHQFLVEKASRENDVVHVFVLEEDLSEFSALIRKEFVEKGTAHLPNVSVHQTGDYMVSAKTFPSYFLKEDANVTAIQASLDAIIFRDRIAPALGITRRYVGEEPLSFATNIYNDSMASVFKKQLELIVVPREERGQEVISASRVRALLKEGKVAETKELLPETTYQFLLSEQGQEIIKKIQTKE